jgi:hypothetical protein
MTRDNLKKKLNKPVDCIFCVVEETVHHISSFSALLAATQIWQTISQILMLKWEMITSLLLSFG